MRAIRITAIVVASLLALLSVAGSLSQRYNYERQDREHCAQGPSTAHWLGTDALGRDRLSRLLHGTRVSLTLAPLAAALSVLTALLVGVAPALAGGAVEQLAHGLIDLMLSVPWLFLLLMVRALLPLNTSPSASALATFLMLGLLGWGMPAKILLARTRRLRQSEFVLLARATGIPRRRLLQAHLMPNLWPVLLAQFWISVPVFILAEANLSLLGLGVSEPLPSLGSLLREMESVLSLRGDLCNFAALLVLVLLVSSLQIGFSTREVA